MDPRPRACHDVRAPPLEFAAEWNSGDSGSLGSIPRVHRPEDSAGVPRRMSVEVDGRLALRVGYGRTAALEVEPGRHPVQPRTDWLSRPVLDVTVADGDAADVQVAYSFTAVTKLFSAPTRRST